MKIKKYFRFLTSQQKLYDSKISNRRFFSALEEKINTEITFAY